MHRNLIIMLAAERQQRYRQDAERHRLAAHARRERPVNRANGIVTWFRSAIHVPGRSRRASAIADPAPVSAAALPVD
jgi:hypothetical protein